MEFSCTRNQFRAGRLELELADHVVAVGDLVMAIQHKERSERDARDEAGEARWFQNKVLGRARRQMEDTARFLRGHTPITVTNQLGQRVTIAPGSDAVIAKVIVYRPSRLLGVDERGRRLCPSETGPIHLFADADYVAMCTLLITPAEIFEYLGFREALWRRVGDLRVGEHALLGQFLRDEPLAEPSEDFAVFARALQRDDSGYAVIRRLMHRFTAGMHQIGEDAPEAVYPRILTTLALLGRNDLIAFQERMLIMQARAGGDIYPASVMISVSPRRCGFVFFAIPARRLAARPIYVVAELVECFKYRHRLDRCLGVALAREGSYTKAEWALFDDPWTEDSELARRSETAHAAGVLPALHVKLRDRYFFENDVLSRDPGGARWLDELMRPQARPTRSLG